MPKQSSSCFGGRDLPSCLVYEVTAMSTSCNLEGTCDTHRKLQLNVNMYTCLYLYTHVVICNYGYMYIHISIYPYVNSVCKFNIHIRMYSICKFIYINGYKSICPGVYFYIDIEYICVHVLWGLYKCYKSRRWIFTYICRLVYVDLYTYKCLHMCLYIYT
jgi:hypothetical protein